MKIKLDKAYTTIANLDRVKADMAAFRSAFTDDDLLRMFCDSGIICSPVSAGCDVISADVEAWSTDTPIYYRTHFSVKMFTFCYTSVCRVWFSIDYNPDTGEYTVRENGCSVDVYEKAV